MHATSSPRPVRPRSPAARPSAALLLRDLTVLRKNIGEFVTRTLVQPFLLVFVFLYVFPTIGQGVGGAAAGQSVAQAESVFATILVAGVIGISIMFQGIQAVAMPLVSGVRLHPRDRGPGSGALPRVAGGGGQGAHRGDPGCHRGGHRFPHRRHRARQGRPRPPRRPLAVLLTVVPLACVAFSSLGLFLGTKFEPRNLGLMFGFIVLPITFLGGTYYAWIALRPVHVGGFHWLQTLVLINPLIYVTEGLRAGLTNPRVFPDPHSAHMHLYVVYPALIAACALFLFLGIRGFRKRVLA